jgi:alpha-glucoside transport system permease protein
MAAAAANPVGGRSALVWAVHLSALLLVALWTLPTFGILISSFREKNQIAVTGWWTALAPSTRNLVVRTAAPETALEKDGKFVLEGRLVPGNADVRAFGVSSEAPAAFRPGQTAEAAGGEKITVAADGAYRIEFAGKPEPGRGRRLFVTAVEPPVFTRENYANVLFSEGIGRSFLNTFVVTIPSTVIPILIAAFAAYALAWMRFPGRALLLAAIVGLLVVPLQMSLIPLLRLYNDLGIGKSYAGIWLAHTGFGLPLAIYLLRNYIAGLPREIIESARVDGATDFEIFLRIVLPLSYPALASFAIFQFLWVWNDLLVALVFLGPQKEQLVLTGQLVNLLGSRGGDWEILTASAFVSIVVPLIVFFALQRYLVRGLLAGSVKGG